MSISPIVADIVKTALNNLPSMVTAAAGFYVVWCQNRKQDKKLDDVHKIVNGNTSRLLDKIPDANKSPEERGE